MSAYRDRVVRLGIRPIGFIPMLMSLTAFAIAIGSVATVPIEQGEEGAAAHMFQLLLAAELPLLAFFAMTWLRKDVPAALTILAIQAAAIGMALFPVWYFHL